MSDHNPLLERWETPFGMPPFADIKPSHFAQAFDVAFAEHNLELDQIASHLGEPDFNNTVLALESSGSLLKRVGAVFANLKASHTSPELQLIEKDIAPRLAAHGAALYQNRALFQRIDALHQARSSLSLDGESLRVLERHHLDFVRAGAKLEGPAREQFAQNTQTLAALFTQFSQSLLADESTYCLVLNNDEELIGLPEFVRQAARQLAGERGIASDHAHAFTLSRSSVMPFMTFSERRDLRERMWRAWCARGENQGPTHNHEVIKRILSLRLEQAQLLGYASFADYALQDTMAGSVAAARGLLLRVWEPARQRALAERQALVALSGLQDFQAWDWHFWAERLRQQKLDLDEAAVRPYLRLGKLTEAMFDVAGRLFGISFHKVASLPSYHQDVRGWEVKDRQGQHLGVFLADNFARIGKRSGAWMSNYRDASDLGSAVRPIVVNNNNFSKAPEGQDTLLSLDDGRTLFHEFGHGLHGLLTRVRFPRLSGTHVLRDFVELPSQLFEHWLLQPEVLRQFARHAHSGEPMPDGMIQQIVDAQTFNQGFATVEYVASALVDLALHEHTAPEALDLGEFEVQALHALGMPPSIGMRHRLPHFSHLFSSNGYAALYYVYMWAEVLDADGFDAFLEAGDIFASDVADRLHRHIYAAGDTQAPMDAYIAFRGREPSAAPLLQKRGLT